MSEGSPVSPPPPPSSEKRKKQAKNKKTKLKTESPPPPPPPPVSSEKRKKQAKKPKIKTFEDLSLNDRLLQALKKKPLELPTPIQIAAIPRILEGKDIIAQAKTGSGKTFAYLLPLLHNLLSGSGSGLGLSSSRGPTAFVLVPTRELSQQVYKETKLLLEPCKSTLRVVELTTSMKEPELQRLLSGPPDVVVSTPTCIQKCLSTTGVLEPEAVQESLSMLILDEADLLLKQGFEDDLKALTAHVPKRCQYILMSATASDDVEKLRKLIGRKFLSVSPPEVDGNKGEVTPKSVAQYWISCGPDDKFVHILALLKLELVQKKVLVFTNTIDMGFRLKLFLEKFGIRAAVLNAELPQNSRQHILEEFNAGLFDYLIAIDVDETDAKQQKGDGKDAEVKKSKNQHKQKLDAEFGVVRGIDFKNVYTVINFEMPSTFEGYIHRIGRTGRAYNTGASVSLVSPDEMEGFEELKSGLAKKMNEEGDLITPFPMLTKNAVDSLRYRAEDTGRSVTRVAIKEARAQDIRNELLNSERLKAHFEANPRDLDLLKHDKVLSKKEPPPHLRDVPEYLLDSATQQASKMLKRSRADLGNGKSGQQQGRKRKFRKNKDPLKAISAEGPKHKRRKGGKKE